MTLEMLSPHILSSYGPLLLEMAALPPMSRYRLDKTVFWSGDYWLEKRHAAPIPPTSASGNVM